MIEWLQRDPNETPAVEIGDATLPIVVRRHPTAQRMTLRLSADGSEIRVTVPRWGRTADALAFARSRSDWLALQLAALPPAEPIQGGGTLRYRGEALEIRHDRAAPRRPSRDEQAIVLGGPEASLASRLRRWLEGEARVLMAADLDEYCRNAGRDAPRLALSNAKRRWGSCAPDGSIRINWRLVMAPDFVRRSVVAHEAAHLVHFDHSPRFYAMLDQIYEGDVAQANAWLKQEGRCLYLPFG